MEMNFQYKVFQFSLIYIPKFDAMIINIKEEYIKIIFHPNYHQLTLSLISIIHPYDRQWNKKIH